MAKQDMRQKVDGFSRDVRSAVERVEHLRKELEKTVSLPTVAMESFQELQTTMAELEAAEEEIVQQYDEILSTRNALEYERARYRDLFDFAPDAYIVTDRNGKIVEANRAACELLKIQPQFIAGKQLASYILDQDLKAFRSKLNLLANASHVQEIGLRIVPRRGGHVDASLKVGPVRDAGGRVVALRWLIRDITERKRAEERVRKLNEELERRVRERTADLQAASEMKEVLLARMQEACDRAEAASRSKDEFLAMVSHELRTPLNAVIGWIEILRRKPDDPAMMERALDVIERNTRAQSQIVNDILEVSRMMTGNLKLEFQPVDLKSVIEKAVDAMTPYANASGLQLVTSFDGSVRPISGDADRLQQVVGNLLTNAVKFTPSGGRIEVRLAQRGMQAQIIVSDTGKGISADFLPHVFDMFRQDDATSRRKFGGLGLGLSIVRYLVEMHGGAVRAESEGEGRGSTFAVTLPLLSSIQQTFDGLAEAGEAGSDQETALNHRLEGVRILAVDDEADTVEMLRVVFEQMGARVTTALSCAEAIKVIESPHRPDVLIADIAMPEENGYDLIRKVRSRGRDRGGDIPAIALTAYAGPEDRLRAMAEGFQMHLAKPVSIHDLISCVVKLAHRQ